MLKLNLKINKGKYIKKNIKWQSHNHKINVKWKYILKSLFDKLIHFIINLNNSKITLSGMQKYKNSGQCR